MSITTALDKTRLLIGDTDVTAAHFSDDEINFFLTENAQNAYRAAADALDALAAKWATYYTFETDGQRFERATVSAQLRARAAELRSREQSVTTLTTTRVDGYSDDLTNQDVPNTSSTVNPRRKYYGREDDLPY